MDKARSHSSNPQLVSRRAAIKFMGISAAAAALTKVISNHQMVEGQTRQPDSSQTAPSNSNQVFPIAMKSIPRTKEMIPAIGLGTFLTFDVLSNQTRDNLQQVLRRFWDAGGRTIDVSPLYGMSEVNVGDFTRELGITNDLFIANKIWATGEYLGDRSQALRQLEQSRKRLSRDRIDVMQVHSLVNAEMIVPLLREWKQEGKIRYIGVTHHDLPLYSAPILRWIERGDLGNTPD
jgi:Aldo/keto reductase family